MREYLVDQGTRAEKVVAVFRGDLLRVLGEPVVIDEPAD